MFSCSIHLSQGTHITVIHASVTSCIDYYDPLLYDIADNNINHFQQIQNGAAHVVTNNRKYSHIKMILQKLVKCVHLKTLITTYMCIYDEVPKYHSVLLLIKKIMPTSQVI